MFHACVQRFDGMDEKILGGELNRALEKNTTHNWQTYSVDKFELTRW